MPFCARTCLDGERGDLGCLERPRSARWLRSPPSWRWSTIWPSPRWRRPGSLLSRATLRTKQVMQAGLGSVLSGATLRTKQLMQAGLGSARALYEPTRMSFKTCNYIARARVYQRERTARPSCVPLPFSQLANSPANQNSLSGANARVSETPAVWVACMEPCRSRSCRPCAAHPTWLACAFPVSRASKVSKFPIVQLGVGAVGVIDATENPNSRCSILSSLLLYR